MLVSERKAWSLATRVTRFGEFSPIGKLFTLARFFFYYRSNPKFGLILFWTNFKSYVLILTKKMRWALFWAIFFSKTIWSPCLQRFRDFLCNEGIRQPSLIFIESVFFYLELNFKETSREQRLFLVFFSQKPFAP
jgi:hypothetical protein